MILYETDSESSLFYQHPLNSFPQGAGFINHYLLLTKYCWKFCRVFLAFYRKKALAKLHNGSCPCFCYFFLITSDFVPFVPIQMAFRIPSIFRLPQNLAMHVKQEKKSLLIEIYAPRMLAQRDIYQWCC